MRKRAYLSRTWVWDRVAQNIHGEFDACTTNACGINGYLPAQTQKRPL